jgi:hypothetical protein
MRGWLQRDFAIIREKRVLAMMITTRLNEAQKAFLANAAQRYIWWETTSGAMVYTAYQVSI